MTGAAGVTGAPSPSARATGEAPLLDPWAPPVRVFAIEPDAVQLDWRALPPGRLEIDGGAAPVAVATTGGPGALVVTGLRPEAEVRLDVRHSAGLDVELVTRTLPAPPGAELCRVATISDVHLGIAGFDLKERMRDPFGHPEHHGFRCARAAIREAVAWGAQHLVVKGDLTNFSRGEEWDEAKRLLDECPIPVSMIPGNHDRYRTAGSVDPDEAARRIGYPFASPVGAVDLPGLRIVLVDTVVPRRGYGRVQHASAEVCDAVAAAPGGVLLALHHNIQPLPFPHHWPPGIPSHEGLPFLRAVARANRTTFVTSGHTHRNRRLRHQVLAHTEVGSCKDYPGVWAGYVAHEGGIRQVLRRVAADEAISWTEHTGDAVFGLWRHWSAGTLADRCLTHPWPERRPPARR